MKPMLWAYLALIAAMGVWVWGWCRGYDAGQDAAKKADIERREAAWAAYLERKRKQNAPLVFPNPDAPRLDE